MGVRTWSGLCFEFPSGKQIWKLLWFEFYCLGLCGLWFECYCLAMFVWLVIWVLLPWYVCVLPWYICVACGLSFTALVSYLSTHTVYLYKIVFHYFGGIWPYWKMDTGKHKFHEILCSVKQQKDWKIVERTADTHHCQMYTDWPSVIG